jgi:predicted RNase H-like nuclease (RuvC/YqgF family)
MGGRSEVQNLKRENKKLKNKVEEQQSAIIEVKRDCSLIKKKQKKEEQKDKNNRQLTGEIKDLLEKLVGYTGSSSHRGE